MPDREKVIRGLTICTNHISPIEDCEKCPYQYEDHCTDTLMMDALDILREQPEPVKPKRESRAMLPCKCGSKRREHWYGWDSGESHEALKCCRCGFKVIGKNATDVIRQWNKAIQEVSGDA